MKILYIHTFYTPHNVGGAENSLRVLVEAMQKNGHEVIVLATSDKKGLQQEMVNGVKVYRGGIKNIYWLYGSREYSKAKKLLWHIKDVYNIDMKSYVKEVLRIEKPDIVSCHNLSGWSIAVWDVIRKANIPIVQVLHDFYFLCAKSTTFKDGRQCSRRCLECRILRNLHRRKSKKVHAVVGVCHDVVNRVVAAGYFSNVPKLAIHNARVIPNIEVQKQKELSDNIVFGFIGSLIPNKGILWLIEQFKKITSKKVVLRIAGKGETVYESMLKDISKDDARISFLGYTKSDDFYSQTDILVIPSIWNEPLASAAIEACAHHIPVITSAAGGLKEIVIDGYNGLYCNPSNPDSLSTAMNRIINDRLLLEKLQKVARESVSSFLDTDRLTQEYEKVYKHLL
jgi:glycosyltransferase involved in cell wall biosynthesis